MNESEKKLLDRWIQRINDPSGEVLKQAAAVLTDLALRYPDQRNFITPKLLEAGNKAAAEKSNWVPALNIITESAAIPRTDSTWAEDFLDLYLTVGSKDFQVASMAAMDLIPPLLVSGAVSRYSSVVERAYKFSTDQIKNGTNHYIRHNLFAIADWYEDGESPDDTNVIEISLPFKWPTTIAPVAEARLDDTAFPLETGVLKTIGYKVGETGDRSSTSRRKLLTGFYEFTPNLPEEHPQALEWGYPKSSARLLKLANTIATLARNAKRRKHPPSIAIADWESDLNYLRTTYYDGIYSFYWPSTKTV